MKAGKRHNLGPRSGPSALVQGRSKTLTIEDDFGTEHSYHISALSARDGAKMWRALLQSGASLGALFKQSTGSKEEAAGIAMQAIATAALDFLDEATLNSLMALVTRDGKSLAKGAMIDLAYGANYGEWGVAIFHVLELNFGPAVRRLLGKLDMEGGMMPQLRELATAFSQETSQG